MVTLIETANKKAWIAAENKRVKKFNGASLETRKPFGEDLGARKVGQLHMHRGSNSASQPAAPGSIFGITENLV